MGRAGNLSALGLYQWDNTLFDLMVIPSALDKEVLVDNLLAETAELEILYPNPVVLKNLLGVWSRKQIDVWNRLYETTQYDYNPIENYNRYETGSDTGTGTETHSGTDGRTESIATGGKDVLDMTRRDGGTETENTTSSVEQGGQDETTGNDKKGHWVAGFDAPTPTAQDDGLFKQTRDEDDATTTTEYGKTEDGEGSKTTTFGKTETNKDETTYGKTETVQEQKSYGESVSTSKEGGHTLHAHGNIGVTTTQKLIKEERSIDLFNVYDIIIQDFKMRFCIMVY